MKTLQSVTGIFLVLFLFLATCTNNNSVTLEVRADNITKAELQRISELLGHDLYEGRAPGTRGGDLAEIYIQSIFKFMNLEPGVNGSYFQPGIVLPLRPVLIRAIWNSICMDFCRGGRSEW